jgi:N-acetyl-beta-hexosaminidase
VKVNHLHLHPGDSYYTQAEHGELVAYAAERHVTVVPWVAASPGSETVATIAEAEEMSLPRIAAEAEIRWSPAADDTQPLTVARDVDEFAPRLAELTERWDAAGMRFPGTPEPPRPETPSS